MEKAIFVIIQLKLAIDLNLVNIKVGYFVAKIVGKQYLNMKVIVMEVQESLLKQISSK